MTRQNVTDGPREVMTKKCPTCGGDGIVISEHTAAVDIERRLRSLVTPGSRDKAFKVEVSARVAWLVAGPGAVRLRELEETTKRRFFLVGVEGEHLDHLRVLDQGTLEKVAPKLPVEVGQQIEVKLGEVGLHDPHAGTGKVGDVDIVVGDAAKLVGKKVAATVTAVTEGLAWAELVSPAATPDEPLTAESEAEKPTRARRASARKSTELAGSAAVEDELEPDDQESPEAELEAGLDDELEPAVQLLGLRATRSSLPCRRSARAAARGAARIAARSRRPPQPPRTAPSRRRPLGRTIRSRGRRKSRSRRPL